MICSSSQSLGPRWPIGKAPASWPKGSRLETRFHPGSAVHVGPLHLKAYIGTKRSTVGMVRKLGERVPAQALSSSSDRGSKLRGPSQNSPRVVSKRVINITKLY
ncbi:hypothetical protein AVEN_49930-1 [Araneus ventricosus]|uniref:Uncharacterized protein n=1 Tax=Araneus ventricosus TaxID=182803 RepID=A0A4Y2J3W4_ARAVE|nr:hypothetical protein AVEN_49930-1 [Araneus ventricosus]